jgi:hypothetical protein
MTMRRHRRATTWLVALSLLSRVPAVLADDESPRPPMSEPILEETTTDIDGTEPGEREIEVNVSLLRSRRGGAFDLQLSPELEVLVLRRLGVKVEPFFERGAQAGSPPGNSAGIGAGVSWKLLQDFEHDFHLQAEASGVYPADTSTFVQPGESPLPFSFDLRSGIRRGAWTLRNSVGVSAGGPSAHVPLRGSAAVLTDLEPSGRFGFWGIEVEADGARAHPVVLAIDLVPTLTPAGLPFSLGFVLPYSVGAPGTAPSYGFFLRLFIESEREQSYARTGQGH